jgi:thiosulfate reductase cytochrome b subunit
LYWGETGAIGTESRVDLALLFITGPSVWNPPIHFLFAWIVVLAGLTYVVAGFVTREQSRREPDIGSYALEASEPR